MTRMRISSLASMLTPIWIGLSLWPSRPAIPLLCLWFAAIPAIGPAQDPLERVEQLYTAAAYDEALLLLDKLEPVLIVDRTRAAETRILCLLAINQTERAEIAIEALLEKVPRYQPTPKRFSPSRLDLFEVVRRRVLPRIIETKYVEAKASFNEKNYQPAVHQLEMVLDLLNDTEDQPRFADVRVGAASLLQSAKLAVSPALTPVGTTGLVPIDDRAANVKSEKHPAVSVVGKGQPSSRARNTAPPPTGSSMIYDTSAADVVPPTALNPILPPVSVSTPVVTPQSGLFEIVVDESGRVVSASVVRSIHSQYDASVLSESRNWRFKPAMRDGQPVKFRKLVEIYAAPLASIRQ